MKKTLVFLLLAFSINIFSQDKAEIKEFFWGKSDEFKTANSVPDKWKNESAVIISKFEFFDYHKFGPNVTYTSAVRKRIKLQDAASVKEFSEFSFNDKFYTNKGFSRKEATTVIGIKIIKPDGKETEIDVEKESKKIDKENKIAIANLEIGDIIDYYFYSIEPFKSIYEFGFDPVESNLGDVYPTMNWKLSFQTENDFFVNFNTYNGAPELKEIATKNSGERKYELIAKDIDKNEFPRWFYPLAELPCYKFQVFFARSGKFEARADAFLSEKERDIKKTVSKDDVFNYYNDKFKPAGELNFEEKFLKDKKFASDEEKVREIYYYTRHEFYTQFIEAQAIQKASIMPYPFGYYMNSTFLPTEQSFINHFMLFLKKNKIDYDIIVGTPRFNGSIDDLLIQRNLSVLLRVNTKTPIYLEYFSPFKTADQFSAGLENSKAFVFQISKGKKVIDAEGITLPSSTAKDNVSSIVSNVSFNEGFSGLKIKRTSSFTGHLKEDTQGDKLYFYDYVNEDYEKYGTKHVIDMVKNKKDHARYAKEFDALITKSKESQKEEFKTSTSKEYDAEIDNHSLVIKNTGRFGSNSPFTFEENFDIKNSFIKKAGPNYILEIGKMITSQVEIDKKEKERKNNIYMAYPRSFENEIVFEIPDGYTVSGIEKFNVNFTNETGKFVSTASLNGNKLIIKTTKQYNNYFEPNSNWPKMIAFLDAAYQFTQEKILLKKN